MQMSARALLCGAGFCAGPGVSLWERESGARKPSRQGCLTCHRAGSRTGRLRRQIELRALQTNCLNSLLPACLREQGGGGDKGGQHLAAYATHAPRHHLHYFSFYCLIARISMSIDWKSKLVYNYRQLKSPFPTFIHLLGILRISYIFSGCKIIRKNYSDCQS